MIVALAFVPIDNLDDAFDALSNQLANKLTPILRKLLNQWFPKYGSRHKQGLKRGLGRDPKLNCMFSTLPACLCLSVAYRHLRKE